MSRNYEMDIRVQGIKKEKLQEILNYLENEWFDESIDDVFIMDCSNDTVKFSLCQRGYLCGGEMEEDFGARLYGTMKEINGEDFAFELESTFLDDPPREIYTFGKKFKD